MRICPECASRTTDDRWHCFVCDWRPKYLHGLPLLSADIIDDFPDYPVDVQEKRIHLEDANFWFLYRSQVINWCLQRFNPDIRKMLEIGCGTGFVLLSISRDLPNIQLFGADVYPSVLHYAQERVPTAEFAQMDAYRLPFIKEFDVIGAFDVLEHMGDDVRALKNFNRAINEGGSILLTVPQHPFLWSAQDDKAFHKRRYTRKELKGKVEAAGFDVIFMTSFITFLLPLMFLSRRAITKSRKCNAEDVHRELTLSPSLNALFKLICSLEIQLIRKSISLPIGGSLLCSARKPSP